MLLKTMLSFLKIGSIGFGGGSALIPVIENEIVKKKQILPEQKYTMHTIVANISPGALPVKLGGMAGYEICGLPGMVVGSTAVTLPGVLATIVILALLSGLGQGAVYQITLASVGISVFIIFLLTTYIKKILNDAKKQKFYRLAICLMTFSFAVTCGKNLCEFLTLLNTKFFMDFSPALSLSTTDLLILTFFVIFFTGGNLKGRRLIVTILVLTSYLFFTGKGCPIESNKAELILKLVMFVLSAVFVFRDSKKDSAEKPRRPEYKRVLLQLLTWSLFIVACLMPALLKSKEAIEFLGDGLLSTVTSFGGGEAYLSIASGMFVSSGAVSTADFYGQLVPVANALPGPILVKLLSGIGYLIGVGQGGMTSGFLFALVGFGAGIGATNFVCVVVHTLYSSFTELKTFQVIKQWILPVICGLLITVVLSMLCEILKVTQTVGIGNIPSIFMIMALYFLIKLLTEKYKLNDILLIILAGGSTVAVLNLI